MIVLPLSNTIKALNFCEEMFANSGNDLYRFVEQEAADRILSEICPEISKGAWFSHTEILRELEAIESLLSFRGWKDLARAQREAINIIVDKIIGPAPIVQPLFTIPEEIKCE